MPWAVIFHEEFEAEYNSLAIEVQDALTASAKLLQSGGPVLGRPHVDTLSGSRFPNMKELRFDAADGVSRLRSTRAVARSFLSRQKKAAWRRRGFTKR